MKSILRKATLLYQHLLYGFSLVLPYTSDRPNYLVIPGVSLILIVFISLMPIIPSIETIFGIVVIVSIIYYIITWKYDDETIIYICKLRAEKYYKIILPDNNISDYSFILEAIRLHRKYGQYGDYEKKDKTFKKIRYLEDEKIIKEYRRFNRKWEFIALVYIIIHVVAVFLW